MGFTITSPVPDAVYAGLIITYSVRPLLNIPVTWVTEITHVVEGERFVDEGYDFRNYTYARYGHVIKPPAAANWCVSAPSRSAGTG